ncbi:transcriptional regulator [Rhizobium wenxiniae]|uniref:HTH-type transcriptional regulator TtuA n=1 Tax=Rhizobium wenxiniae TaxID=1737357 RepID=A0A7X0D1W9_9HYPH|nr:LysR family transcriptional regulator [Rhizobium wenxiniae]MBB6164892.1 DNA-binding transcriptional LysR family regulator [Rhizobium wenxiniae]GGG11233.1 transcriptional regulator [Rhizobium wenxiniae]
MLDRIAGMEVFAKVAAIGSLSGAARALNMSPTMATKHMAALEDRLGVKLLHRTTRKITLNEAGRRYLESVERILLELSEADATAAAERMEVGGTLRVNVPVSFGVREIVPLLAELADLHPALSVDLGLSDRTVDLVEEGWDVAIRIGRIEDQSLIARRIARCRMLLAASPAYLAKRSPPASVSELGSHNCLGYTLSSSVGPDRWRFGFDGSIIVPVTGNLHANNGDALVAAALAGQGMIYQPTFLVGDEIRAGRLVSITLDEPLMELPGVFAIYASNRRPPAKVRAFIDFLAGKFAPAPRWDRNLPISAE